MCAALAGNGAAELIKSLIEGIYGDIGLVLPTFEEYPNRCEPSRIVSYCPTNKDFYYTADELISFFGVKDISTLIIVNPDNPSGNFIPYESLQKLIFWSKNKNIRLVIDESFVDFSVGYENNSLLRDNILEQNPHLVVMKSISKSYGVPGLRLGILASGDTELISRIKRDVAIWNINSFAEFYMQIYGKYEGDYKRACEKFLVERERFFMRLQSVPFLRVIPSQANYFLCEVLPPYTSSELTQKLLKCNILIKDCSPKKAFRNKEYIRIAIRGKNDNEKLIDALRIL